MRSYISQEEVETLKGHGFRVFVPESGLTTYLYFVEGDNIAYLQRSTGAGALEMGTLHIPNRVSGAGFSMGEVAIEDAQALRVGFRAAPGWADAPSRESVRKWPSLEAFLKARTIIPLSEA